jgi:hypothetical protein
LHIGKCVESRVRGYVVVEQFHRSGHRVYGEFAGFSSIIGGITTSGARPD